jgi:hypothetical protein
MAAMNEAPDFDPIRKSMREGQTFNLAWMKSGEKMTWMQRIGFAIISFPAFRRGFLLQRLQSGPCEMEICFRSGA